MILNVLWGPGMSLYPHDHREWAVIGIYSGREDNSFYRRSESGLIVQGGKTLEIKDTIPLGAAVIHSVTNPLDQITAAIDIYEGDFFAVPRSEWDPRTLEERPCNIEHAREVFEKANERIALRFALPLNSRAVSVSSTGWKTGSKLLSNSVTISSRFLSPHH